MQNCNFVNIKFYIIVMVLSFIACNKIEDELPLTKIKGIIRNQITHQTIAGARISLLKSVEINPYINTTQIDTMEVLFSDAQGRYQTSFHAKDFENGHPVNYYYAIDKVQGCYTGLEAFGVQKGKMNYREPTMTSHGYITIHVKNTTPFDNNDCISLCVNTTYFTTNCETNPGGGYTGMNWDFDYLNNAYTIYGLSWLKIHWWVTKNNITNAFVDSVYINPCSNNYYNINY